MKNENFNQEKSILKSLLPQKKNYKKWAVLVGPEGGFSDSEKTLISKSKNVLVVSLGTR